MSRHLRRDRASIGLAPDNRQGCTWKIAVAPIGHDGDLQLNPPLDCWTRSTVLIPGGGRRAIHAETAGTSHAVVVLGSFSLDPSTGAVCLCLSLGQRPLFLTCVQFRTMQTVTRRCIARSDFCRPRSRRRANRCCCQQGRNDGGRFDRARNCPTGRHSHKISIKVQCRRVPKTVDRFPQAREVGNAFGVVEAGTRCSVFSRALAATGEMPVRRWACRNRIIMIVIVLCQFKSTG